MPSSQRSTTYDATIGDIVYRGKICKGDTFELEKRGVVWVVSREEFAFDNSKTGMATLKTTLTHQGLLALNVGIIDPGWKGPLATALVNFSGQPISISIGQPFFRVVVFNHNPTILVSVEKPRDTYLLEIQNQSRLFAETFLDTHSLVDEVALSVFKFPKWAVMIGLGTLLVAIAAIFAPITFDVWTEHRNGPIERDNINARIEQLETDIRKLKTKPKPVSDRAESINTVKKYLADE